MQTVVEPAGLGDLRDVGEDRVDAAVVFEQSQLAHAGSVDEHSATGQQHELAPGRRVAAAGIVFPDVADVLDVATRPAG